jgi:hypothetical protein
MNAAETPLTAEAIHAMPDGRPMDRLIDARFFKEPSLRSWSRNDADAVCLMRELVERLPEGDFHLEHREPGGWAASTCFASGEWRNWVNAGSFRLVICRAALLTTLEATP